MMLLHTPAQAADKNYTYDVVAKNVIVKSGVTTIVHDAFNGNKDIKTVSLPEGITQIGEAAFSMCFALESINLPDSITLIDKVAFANCLNLKSPIIIPDGVTELSAGSFQNCTKLTQVTLPQNLVTIGASALTYCSGLTSLTIPKSVTSIGKGAFSSSGLKTITMESAVPPSLDKDAYKDVPADFTITVPCSPNHAYKIAAGWSGYQETGSLTNRQQVQCQEVHRQET